MRKSCLRNPRQSSKTTKIREVKADYLSYIIKLWGTIYIICVTHFKGVDSINIVKIRKPHFYYPTKRHTSKQLRINLTVSDLEGTGITEETKFIYVEFDKINKRVIFYAKDEKGEIK